MRAEDVFNGCRVRIVDADVDSFVGREATIISDAPFDYIGQCVHLLIEGKTGSWVWSLNKLEPIPKIDNAPLPLPGDIAMKIETRYGVFNQSGFHRDVAPGIGTDPTKCIHLRAQSYPGDHGSITIDGRTFETCFNLTRNEDGMYVADDRGPTALAWVGYLPIETVGKVIDEAERATNAYLAEHPELLTQCRMAWFKRGIKELQANRKRLKHELTKTIPTKLKQTNEILDDMRSRLKLELNETDILPLPG